MSASAPHSSVVARTKADPEQLSPDAVFERLFDMFGMMADANVILEVGESAGWKRKYMSKLIALHVFVVLSVFSICKHFYVFNIQFISVQYLLQTRIAA